MSIVVMYGYLVTHKNKEVVYCQAIENKNCQFYDADGRDINALNLLPSTDPNYVDDETREKLIRQCPISSIFIYDGKNGDSSFFQSKSPASNITSYNLTMNEVIVGLPILRSAKNADSPTQAPFLLVEENQRDEFFQHWKHFRETMPRTSRALSDEIGVPRFYYLEIPQ